MINFQYFRKIEFFTHFIFCLRASISKEKLVITFVWKTVWFLKLCNKSTTGFSCTWFSLVCFITHSPTDGTIIYCSLFIPTTFIAVPFSKEIDKCCILHTVTSVHLFKQRIFKNRKKSISIHTNDLQLSVLSIFTHSYTHSELWYQGPFMLAVSSCSASWEWACIFELLFQQERERRKRFSLSLSLYHFLSLLC